ncbi:MAG: LytR family transcriptional regulator [Nocardioidaceae bacterium]|nr:LytR family transcriptional regulator [Nocardioidaceae bacterium]
MATDGSGKDGYDWLYGDRPATPPPASDPGDAQPTQVAPQPDLPPPNLPPPGGGRPTPSRPPKPPRKRKPWRWVRTIVLLWLAFLIAVPIWAWLQIGKVDAEPNSARPGDQPGTTYLLVGSDSRRGLSAEQRKALKTGKDTGGRGRTDTIMLMHVGSGPTLLMSIPRDSLVSIPGRGTTKINAAYAFGGPELLVRTIEKNTGIRVDNYIEVGFGGFVNVVDAVGGIQICPKTNIKDPDAGINLKKGCQEVDGATALGYSRSRHTYATQDIQRVQSQREVLGAIAGEVKSPWTVLNPFRYAGIASGASKSLQIGNNVGPVALARFGWNLSAAMSGSGLNCTVPLADFSVRWDAARSKKMFDYIKTDNTAAIGNLCTANGLPK